MYARLGPYRLEVVCTQTWTPGCSAHICMCSAESNDLRQTFGLMKSAGVLGHLDMSHMSSNQGWTVSHVLPSIKYTRCQFNTGARITPRPIDGWPLRQAQHLDELKGKAPSLLRSKLCTYI